MQLGAWDPHYALGMGMQCMSLMQIVLASCLDWHRGKKTKKISSSQLCIFQGFFLFFQPRPPNYLTTLSYSCPHLTTQTQTGKHKQRGGWSGQPQVLKAALRLPLCQRCLLRKQILIFFHVGTNGCPTLNHATECNQTYSALVSFY